MNLKMSFIAVLLPSLMLTFVAAQFMTEIHTVVNCAANNLLTVEYSGCELAACNETVTTACIGSTPRVSADDATLSAQDRSGYYMLMMFDPDASEHGDVYVHWLMYDIPKSSILSGSLEGGNDAKCPYVAPSLPSGTIYHRYKFILYEQTQNNVEGIADPMTQPYALAAQMNMDILCAIFDRRHNDKEFQERMEKLRRDSFFNNPVPTAVGLFRLVEEVTTTVATTEPTTVPTTEPTTVQAETTTPVLVSTEKKSSSEEATTTVDEALVLNQQDQESTSAIIRGSQFVLLLLVAVCKVVIKLLA